MSRRVRKRSPLIALVLTAVACALVALLAWRTFRQPPAVLHAQPTVTRPTGNAEDFSATERQSLEEILKRKDPGTRP